MAISIARFVLPRGRSDTCRISFQTDQRFSIAANAERSSSVAQRGIPRFQVADRLRVLQHLQSALNSFEPYRIKSIVLRHVLLAVVSGRHAIAVMAKAWVEAGQRLAAEHR
jgi:hypothetical protein